MSDNVAVEFPEIEFIRPCNLCPHMKRITLPKILASLQNLEHRVEVEAEVAERARRAVERMLAVGRGVEEMSHRLDAVREADVVVLGAGAAGLSVALGLGGRRIDLLAKGPARPDRQQPARAGRDRGGGRPRRLAGAPRRRHAGGGGRDRRRGRRGAADRRRASASRGADRARHPLRPRRRRPAGPRPRGGALPQADPACARRDRRRGGARPGRGRRTRVAACRLFERARALVDLVSDAGGSRECSPGRRGRRPACTAPRAVVLATGGIGQLYARTTNPAEATGDGLALAARAGARLADLEFVQFHPTALAAGRDPMPLLTEALRGEGARRRRRRPAGASWPTSIRPGVGRRATWWRGRSGGGWRRASGSSSTPGRRWATAFPERFPDRLRGLPARRSRPAPRADPGGPGRPLPHGRDRRRSARAAARSRAVGLPARSPPPASTAPTGWPATRCSRRWCSGRGWRGRVAGGAAGSSRRSRRRRLPVIRGADGSRGAGSTFGSRRAAPADVGARSASCATAGRPPRRDRPRSVQASVPRLPGGGPSRRREPAHRGPSGRDRGPSPAREPRRALPRRSSGGGPALAAPAPSRWRRVALELRISTARRSPDGAPASAAAMVSA